ncbi:hypothetical protein M433DRAFT_62470 [Acidomyces richmondensis BFW]|nr:MAG: hypothetical protein FE78DRAFT_28472 [Acidomyces sp. 'richmondensis']KYG47748.1 hypothetical protein M433DRAFT_62470 [Acidomyces richmondensis BFW]
MPYLTREVQLYYEVHGTGPPVLLTHGYSSSSAMWQGQIEAFIRKGFMLIIWDMRGHGKTSYPVEQTQYSEAHTVADMAALLDEVCGERSAAIIGGLSLGGYMSLAFYRVHPQRVQGLLIIDTGPGFKNDKAREAWNETAYKTGSRLSQYGLSVLQEASPERSQVTHRGAHGLVLAARGMLAQRNAAVIESLPSIRVPTLIVVGKDDKPFLAAAEYMAKKIPGATKIEIPDAGHAVNIDQPRVFNETVIGFLSSLPGGRSGRKAML